MIAINYIPANIFEKGKKVLDEWMVTVVYLQSNV